MSSVQMREDAIRQAETAILETIVTPMPTRELVAALKPRFRDEYPVRAAIWFLIGRGVLKITRDDNQVRLARV